MQFKPRRFLIICLFILSIAIPGPKAQAYPGKAFDSPVARRVNVIYSAHGSSYPSQAIFWFGKVDPYNNYADVRLIYYDELLKVTIHIMDRQLWSNPTPSTLAMDTWDSVSLYLDRNGNAGQAPVSNSYRFDAQLSNLEAGFKGNGSGWISSSVPFTVTTNWRGAAGPNSNIDAKGWSVEFQIPFQSLGISNAPPHGQTWGLGIVLNDRDDAAGTAVHHSQWPETMNSDIPATWGQMHFGMPTNVRPPALSTQVVTIRQGLNATSVPDGEAGGDKVCGAPYGPDYWPGWGSANYAGEDQINIQNQWDIADWPCFSKYYVTFPLDALPKGKLITSATLTMYMFGTAGGGQWGEPPDSYIQAFTVGEDWNESTLTWNNAPLVLENISGTWVHPIKQQGLDDVYHWNVSQAVIDAYNSGKPLRLALYSADGEYHTGKYFWTSDASDWNATERPTLQVNLGTPCDAPGTVCRFQYLPMIR